MTDLLIAAWDGAGAVPPVMSVARALVERGHDVRVIGDPVLRRDVDAAGAEHVSWTRAPHRKTRSRDTLFIEDYGPQGFGAMRDNLAVGPAAAFAADVREELERRPAALVLTELLLFGPVIAAEALGIPCVVLNPTINIVPTEGVPPFGPGFLPATTEEERERDRAVGEEAVKLWDVALPALNAARTEQGLPPLEHVLDQGRSAARVLVMTSAGFDFVGPLPPTVRYVGPRLDDMTDCGHWEPPPGDEPLVLVALSSDFQDQEDILRRVVLAVEPLPIRAVVTTGRGIDPNTVDAPPNVQVRQLAPHGEILRQGRGGRHPLRARHDDQGLGRGRSPGVSAYGKGPVRHRRAGRPSRIRHPAQRRVLARRYRGCAAAGPRRPDLPGGSPSHRHRH